MINDTQKRILVLSPHTDDGELGAGGTIARLLDEGNIIYYLAFSGCETSLPQGLPIDTLRKECVNSTNTLGLKKENVSILNFEVRTFPEHRQEILDAIIRIKNDYRPEVVIIPSSNDMHQDHGVIYCEALRAFKKEASIWGYEHPWNNLSFTTDIFIKLNDEHVERKIKSLQKYESQAKKSYMMELILKALMITRGSQIDTKWAESFELIRSIM